MSALSPRMERAQIGWNEDVPEWITALVEACDEADSQRLVADRLMVSRTLISQAISNSYSAPLDSLESRVRAVYLSGNVDCPVLSRITAEECLHWRDKASKAIPRDPLRARMRRACHRCPMYQGEKV